MSDKNICKICKDREMHRRYVQADTLLFICYCWRSKFIYKYEDINILGTRYVIVLDSTLDAR